MEAGRNRKERSQILNAYLLAPQNWNRYAYCVNNPVNLIDPSGLIWLTQNNESYIWVDDEYYKNNQVEYKDYSVANGAVTRYQGSTDCAQCEGLQNGDLVQLNENGNVDRLAFTPDPNTTVYSGGEYSSYSLGFSVVNFGGIVDSSRQIYPTFGVGWSWATYSYSQTYGDGPVTTGLYLQGSVSNGLAVNESINVFHPLKYGISQEVGWGTPNGGVGFQLVGPPLQGTTPSDWARHPDNPKRIGLWLNSGGRCPF